LIIAPGAAVAEESRRSGWGKKEEGKAKKQKKEGECFAACGGWGKPFEKGCSPNPFPKFFLLAPMSGLRLRLWRVLWKNIEEKKEKEKSRGSDVAACGGWGKEKAEGIAKKEKREEHIVLPPAAVGENPLKRVVPQAPFLNLSCLRLWRVFIEQDREIMRG